MRQIASLLRWRTHTLTSHPFCKPLIANGWIGGKDSTSMEYKLIFCAQKTLVDFIERSFLPKRFRHYRF